MTFNEFIKSINKETCTDENGYPYYQTYQLKEAYLAGLNQALALAEATYPELVNGAIVQLPCLEFCGDVAAVIKLELEI